jgi:hypothetical protein
MTAEKNLQQFLNLISQCMGILPNLKALILQSYFLLKLANQDLKELNQM